MLGHSMTVPVPVSAAAAPTIAITVPIVMLLLLLLPVIVPTAVATATAAVALNGTFGGWDSRGKGLPPILCSFPAKICFAVVTQRPPGRE